MLISSSLAFASLSHVAGWVWERAFWRDYSIQGIEGPWGIWLLNPDIDSSLHFFLGYLFISRFCWTCACAPCVWFLVGSWLWVVVVEWGGWGLRGLCRHQDGAIQVAVAVTGTVVWAVLTCSALDALEELVDSWELLAVSRALVFSSHWLYLGPYLPTSGNIFGWSSRDPNNHFFYWFTLKYQRLEIWPWSMYIALTSTPTEMK